MKVRRIVELFGDQFQTVLTDKPGRIAEALKMPLDSVLPLRSEWIRRREFTAAFTALPAQELTHH